MSRFSQLAQTAYNTNYPTTTAINGPDIARLFALSLPFAILEFVGLWKTFKKAGRPGWAAIIPFYNYWVLFEIAGKPGWWSLLALTLIIPVVNFVTGIIFLVLFVLVCIELSKRFGRTGAFALLLIFLPFVGFMILGFGKDTYQGNPTDTGVGYTPNGPNGPTPPAQQV